MRLKPWIAAACALALLACVPALAGGSKARARAEATVAKGTPGVFRQVVATGDEAQSAAGPIGEAGISVASSQASVSGTLAGGRGAARATAVARTVDLFDGLVTAYGVRRSAQASGGKTSYSGAVNGLKLAGKMIGDVGGPASYSFEGGTATVNSGTSGLLVVLDDGRSVAIADVSAGARDEVKAKPKPTATPTATAEPTAKPAEKKRKKARKKAEKPPPPPQRLLTTEGFVFPVGGQASIADDFHGPRQIGPHQGNDIFAPFGTPVLAVADGVLHKVGTLPISGNRLWLRSDAGDEYFYAHLSSFSPRAQSRRRVKAGTVLGYVGNTGDAEPTPPHVHFEIHPGHMEAKAVDPHEVLLTWQGDAGSLRRFGLDPAGRPGALVEVRDFLAE